MIESADRQDTGGSVRRRALAWLRRVARGLYRRRRAARRLWQLADAGETVVVDLGNNLDSDRWTICEHFDAWHRWAMAKFGGVFRAGRAYARFLPAGQSVREFHLVGSPLAILELPSTHEDYLDLIGPKSRNMIRKAARSGYMFRRFEWNDRLDDIYQINTSMTARQGRPMTDTYTRRPEDRAYDQSDYSRSHQIRNYGGFKGGHLVAYCCLHFCGDLAIINQILGHGDHLPFGVMNGLVDFMVQDCLRETSAKYVNYLTMRSATSGLSSFKKHVGFRDRVVLLRKRPAGLDPVCGGRPHAQRRQE